jgi:hypothetical protein
VTLPYWDVTLDEAMDKPYNSVIWSDDFMGGGEGAVRSGSFGHWDTQFGYGHLRRILAGQGHISLIPSSTITVPRAIGAKGECVDLP